MDEADSSIRLQMDSKPEDMDKLERRIIQLKLEEQALAKEKDEASHKRLELIELEREQAEQAPVMDADLAGPAGHARLALLVLDRAQDGDRLVREPAVDRLDALRQVPVGVAAAVIGNPLNATRWLAKKMAEVGSPLEAGDIVLSSGRGPVCNAVAGSAFTVYVQGFKPLHVAFE